MTRGRELAELAAGYDSGGGFGFRNRIINPAMVIDQRNAGVSVTVTSTVANTFIMDRWAAYTSQASKFSVQRSTVAPAGFINSALITSLSAYTPLSSDEFDFSHSIEGLNVADLAWGTASAQTVTISFWVRSSLTGTFGASVRNGSANRSYPFVYTISAANTWEQKTATIPGDTSGTWLTTNGIGLGLIFSMGAGSSNLGTAGVWAAGNFVGATGQTNLISTNGATFYITGVQLEKGSTATSFDVRPYGTELLLCQRYLPAFNSSSINSAIGVGQAVSTTAALVLCTFPVPTRVAPTGISVSNVSHITTRQATGGNVSSYTTVVIGNASANCAEISLSGGSGGLTAGNATMGLFNNASGQIQFTGCEL